MEILALSAYEVDLQAQPDALERAARQQIPKSILDLNPASFDRIILTGMGASDSASIPFEIRLARIGLPVWRVQTSMLLAMPELITGRTLLWITSQSGRSGEVVALVSAVRPNPGVVIVAMTNDLASPLAENADHVVELLSGPEATVSCKSYINSLAWFHRLAASFTEGSDERAVTEILSAASAIRDGAEADHAITELVDRMASPSTLRLALVGWGAHAATAAAGALILKEAAKVAAEGYAGGAFRHGPIELARPGLTVLLFGGPSPDSSPLTRLAGDLAKTGAVVANVTPEPLPGSQHLPLPPNSPFAELVLGMQVVQRLSVHLARRAGLVAGAFQVGQKVTNAL